MPEIENNKWNLGKHSWNVDHVKTLTREEFIKQASHLDAAIAGQEYDKIVPPTKKDSEKKPN